MRSLVAFMKKELMEQIRSGRMLLIGTLFVLFGIMNPAVAKLTPWLLETLSDSLAQSGMIVTGVTVSAMDSWVQFFKNIPMALIAFVLLEGNIFTKEYESKTLILSLTKGLSRNRVVISKGILLFALWSASYWTCFGITYGYNAYYWDNSVAENLIFSALCWWLFGMTVLSLLILFSTVFSSASLVLCATGGAVFGSYLVGVLPKINKYLPTFLTNGNALIYGTEIPSTYFAAMSVCTAICILSFVIGILLFQKKQL